MGTDSTTGRPELVILASRGDAAASALALLLRRRGRISVALIDEAAWASARFVHRPASGLARSGQAAGGEDGGMSTGALTGDAVQVGARMVVDAGVRAVWCRLPAVRAARLPAGDQEYGDAELFALTLSWLTGLGDRVINQPHPTGLSGRPIDVVELHHLAAQVGLATPEIVLRSNESAARDGTAAGTRGGSRRRQWDGLMVPMEPPSPVASPTPPLAEPACWAEPLTDLRTVVITGDQVPAVPGPDGTPLARLAASAGLRLAEVTLGRRPGENQLLVAGLASVPTMAAAGDLPVCAAFLERRAHAVARVAA